MADHVTFERVRDAYFIDPKAPDASELARYGGLLIREVVEGRDFRPAEVTDKTPPLSAVAQDIAKDYTYTGAGGTRTFDHLSAGQLHPADNMIGIMAHIASTIKNNNTIIGEVSPLETSYEIAGLHWIERNIAGYDPDKASGAITSGGTSANLTAMLVARRLAEERGWDGQTPIKLFASPMAHYSIKKTTGVLAPGKTIQLERAPLERGGYRMDPKALEEQVAAARANGEPIMAIVACAGETETGLVDDLDAIADIAEKYGVYLHVDAAYGAPYSLSTAGGLFKGLNRANSITCDPHKYLYTPYSSGAILFRDANEHAVIQGLNSDGAGYMFQPAEEKSQARRAFTNNTTYLGQRRIEGSMGGQAAAALYHTIRHLGREGIAALLNHNLEMAKLFTEELARQNTSLEVAFSPDLNAVCVRPTEEVYLRDPQAADRRIEQVLEPLENKYGIYLSRTGIPRRNGEEGIQQVLRVVPTHPFTSGDDIVYIAHSLKDVWEETEHGA